MLIIATTYWFSFPYLISFNPPKNPMKKVCHDPRFTDEKNEAPRGLTVSDRAAGFGGSRPWVPIRALCSGWVTLVSNFSSEDLFQSDMGGRMKTLPVKPHRVWSLSLVLLPPCLSLAAQLTPACVSWYPGLCQDGSGAELGGGSGEDTLEAILCPGISLGTPPGGRNVAWSWLRVTWRAGRLVSGSS